MFCVMMERIMAIAFHKSPIHDVDLRWIALVDPRDETTIRAGQHDQKAPIRQ